MSFTNLEFFFLTFLYVTSFVLGAACGALLVLYYFLSKGAEVPRVFIIRLEKTAPRRNKRISGFWYSVFWRKSKSGDVKKKIHVIKILRFKNTAIGLVERGHYQKFRLSGVLAKDEYLTGTWSNPDPAVAFRGSFQLRIHDDGDTISGKWLGWNKDHSIASGLWVMTRMTDDEVNDSKHIDNLTDTPNTEFEHFGCNMRVGSIVSEEKSRDRQLGWKEV